VVINNLSAKHERRTFGQGLPVISLEWKNLLHCGLVWMLNGW